MTALKQMPKAPVECEGYMPLPLAALPYLEDRRLDYYRYWSRGQEPLRLNDANLQIGQEQLEELKLHGEEHVLVKKGDFQRISAVFMAELETILTEDSLTLELRFALFQWSYLHEIERRFRKSSLQDFVSFAQQLGYRIAALAQQGQMSITSLHQVLLHESRSGVHLTNVAAYAMAVATSSDSVSSDALPAIATGCLLHEVGKLYMPQAVLNKVGRPSINERQELEKAPQLAYEALLDFKQLELGQLMMVYQQHERFDGTGYPVRIVGEEIHPWARLLAVVDEFDRVTCTSPNRSAMNLNEGLLHLTNIAKSHLDPKFTLCLITNSQSP